MSVVLTALANDGLCTMNWSSLFSTCIKRSICKYRKVCFLALNTKYMDDKKNGFILMNDKRSYYQAFVHIYE